MQKSTYPFQLPPLPYAYDALEPYIDAETLHYHHDKHFKAYIDNLNRALEPYPALHGLTLEQLLGGKIPLPPAAKTAILNNAGGVFNHTLYFSGLSPADSGMHTPQGALLDMINSQFGSFAEFKRLFTEAALAVFGSGWTFLTLGRQSGLEIKSVKNQDTVVPAGLIPLLTFDVWEHAYYLKYKNLRADYLAGLWSIVNFPQL